MTNVLKDENGVRYPVCNLDKGEVEILKNIMIELERPDVPKFVCAVLDRMWLNSYVESSSAKIGSETSVRHIQHRKTLDNLKQLIQKLLGNSSNFETYNKARCTDLLFENFWHEGNRRLTLRLRWLHLWINYAEEQWND